MLLSPVTILYKVSYSPLRICLKKTPAPTSAPTPTPASLADIYLVLGIIGIILAIVIGFALVLLALKKR